MISRLDQRIKDAFQNIYLWLWDWTGITVGMILFTGNAVCIGGHYLRYGGVAFTCIGLTMFALVGGLHHWMQLTSKNGFNAASMAWEAGIPRRIFTGMQVCFLVLDMISMNFVGMVFTSVYLSNNYLFCIKVRDREPKEFKFLSPAPQRSGA